MKNSENLSDRIAFLFEKGEVCIKKDFDLPALARLLGLDAAYLKKYFDEELDYSFEEMKKAYRGEYHCLLIPGNANLS